MQIDPIWQVPPGQQVELAAPQLVQDAGDVPILQPSPEPQVFPLQHCWFVAPQALQVLFAHTAVGGDD